MGEHLEASRHLYFDVRNGTLVSDEGRRLKCSRRKDTDCSYYCPLLHYNTDGGNVFEVMIFCGCIPVHYKNVEVMK